MAIVKIEVARAVRDLRAVYERFREIEYKQIEPVVYGILADLTAKQAIEACRAFGLKSPNTKKAVVEGIVRAILERKESWDRVASIGASSPFTF